MCGTTNIQCPECDHVNVQVRPGSQCAIGFANNAEVWQRLFCWEKYPQGIIMAPGPCSSCRFRQRTYGSMDTALSLQRLAAIKTRKCPPTTRKPSPSPSETPKLSPIREASPAPSTIRASSPPPSDSLRSHTREPSPSPNASNRSNVRDSSPPPSEHSEKQE